MTKRIILMRHAKSSWSTGESDHNRPLNKRGRGDAPRVAAAIQQFGWAPDCVVSSDSQRTRETWSLMAPIFPNVSVVRFTNRLYHAGVAAVENEIEGLEPSSNTVLFLGHNPGWEDVLTRLTGEYVSITTGNALLLEKNDSDWINALYSSKPWRICAFFRPREL